MDIKKWHYMVDKVTREQAIEERLGHWGELGWELVQIIEDKGIGKKDFEYEWTLILKMPLQ